ncbi:S-adenosyl-L-methionine-dependent methyltransferase [Pyronema omphalodes]|nr:S-adenosyl-L-methionine-dependent methyltransferase [Pyronema omphalodes]
MPKGNPPQVFQQTTTIEVDPAMLTLNNNDDYESSGYSLNSGVDRYVYENGRRYHAYYGMEKNLMPNDETEQDRLDLHHEIMLQLLDGELHLAPLRDDVPMRVLDIGTGTGIWAIDFADKYPNSQVLGTDLSPIQPIYVPPNCRFEVDDAEQDWLWPTDHFDFIHLRNLAQSMSSYPALLKQAYSRLKPGAYLELGELGAEIYSDDNTLSTTHGFKRYLECIHAAFNAIGRPQQTAATIQKLLEDAGFIDIQVSSFKQPFGPWPQDTRMKEIGAMVLVMTQTALEAYGMAPFTRYLGMSQEEAAKICDAGVASVRNRHNHVYSY